MPTASHATALRSSAITTPTSRKLARKNRERQRRYHAENPEKSRSQAAAFRARHPERHLAWSVAWAKANPEKVREYKRKWDKANPEKKRDMVRKRRARRAKAFVAEVHFEDVLLRDMGICGICNEQILDTKVELDHIVPIAIGGTHEPSNVQLAHASCNRIKWANLEGQIHLPV